MSFFESLGKVVGSVAGAACDELQAKNERIQNYKDRHDRLDDESLINKTKSSHGDEKIACMMLLKERGYGNNN
ncbi:hypothetical protein BXY41_11656 [Lacrimispora xylanisolvens]|uniref:Uncharacterized protein n=1 Tax=Lacrimispora xylanisolvens TaxID=384636 RepID=A0A2S6HJ80_9FIRM|nr:hypothetical protein [Hungatella xylanolytica]PPK77517.1 hypothetical protein BXY41_11656 [Hungatella xylanolytica]